MSRLKDPVPARLVISVLIKDQERLQKVSAELETYFGTLEMVSTWMDFNYTDYYEKEMGAPLFRRMFTFKDLIEQENLHKIKLTTIKIEQKFTNEMGQRKVNLDPGYMTPERFVLATGKNFTHRIYLGRKIYADLTLIYQKGAFKPLPWTYPDYQATSMLVFLQIIRQRYMYTIKGLL